MDQHLDPVPDAAVERGLGRLGAEAVAKGGVGSQRLLNVGEIVPEAEIAEALEIGVGSHAVVRRRLMLFDGRPVELTDSYYPLPIAQGTALAEPRKIKGGAITLLGELGHLPVQVREDVYARRPSETERETLGLSDHEWVLGLSRLSKTADGRPVEVSVMTMVPWGRRLRYELSIDRR
ncbi:UTRA domain-containing protein [Micromonospora sp. WMMD1102]|uniref:UTRA domain-containing protein n=1 Tax=Micromonospora sp. WMMD1102 TaxID=3016105 RepID=UPI002414D1CE|nr:UTRA domain-containing protein [Micromonospora sp. WMMD1102]MDG4790739.1 UTRA domain-containing protein [Micromonospora sp. WMMD1102]MDG4792186.1 UTRA domain-containing protein [Micromonospora sp. WMMD1102]